RARWIENLRALDRQVSGVFADRHDTGQYFLESPGEAAVGNVPIEGLQHPRVVLPGLRVHGKDARSVPDTEAPRTGEFPVHEAGESRDVCDSRQVRFAVQDGLVEMRDAPALGNRPAE